MLRRLQEHKLKVPYNALMNTLDHEVCILAREMLQK